MDLEAGPAVEAGVWTQAGLFIFAVVLIATWVGSLQDYGRLGQLPEDEQAIFRRETRRAIPWTLVLVAAQIVFVLVMYLSGSLQAGIMVASNYVFIGLVLPFMWGSGRVQEYRQGLPLAGAGLSRSKKWGIIAVLGVLGSVFSLILFRWTNVTVGSSVTEISKAGDMGIVALLALWLMFNAPWLEEMVFRHYMLVKLGGAGRNPWIRYGFAVLVTSALFAVGHAGHMVPAWPKLVQTFVWGVALGYTRIFLGTGYAVALHTGFNVLAVVVASFISWEG